MRRSKALVRVDMMLNPPRISGEGNFEKGRWHILASFSLSLSILSLAFNVRPANIGYTYCWWQPEIRCENQLRLVVYPIIYRVFSTIPGGSPDPLSLTTAHLQSHMFSRTKEPGVEDDLRQNANGINGWTHDIYPMYSRVINLSYPLISGHL